MTKRGVEDDVAELSEALLGKLTPAERLTLSIEASAADADHHLDRLVETCPVQTYQGPDLAYLERRRLAVRLRDQTVYQLHTTALTYEAVEVEHCTDLQEALAAAVDEPAEADESSVQRCREQADALDEMFAELYHWYYAARQFAETYLDVNLETRLAGHADGALVCAGVETILMDGARARTAEAYLSAPADADRPYDGPETYPDGRASEGWTTLNDVARWCYDAYASSWTAALEEILK